jgi:hypothetical protein
MLPLAVVCSSMQVRYIVERVGNSVSLGIEMGIG